MTGHTSDHNLEDQQQQQQQPLASLPLRCTLFGAASAAQGTLTPSWQQQ